MGGVFCSLGEEAGISRICATAPFSTFVVVAPLGVSFGVLIHYTEAEGLVEDGLAPG